MNIDSIKNYPTGVVLSPKRNNSNGLMYKQKSVDLCDNKSVNRGYSGSFTGMNGAAADFSTRMFEKVLTLCDKHTVIAQNLVALVMAAGLRPVAIMSLPGKKDKEDKIYASGHSIASGVIGFGFSSIVMYPLGQAVEKTKKLIKNAGIAMQYIGKPESEIATIDRWKIKDLKAKYKLNDLSELENVKIFKKMKEFYKVDTLSDLGHSKVFKNVTKILDMAPDVFIFGVAKAMLTVALIPPILKYGFGLEKRKKPAVVNQQNQQNQQLAQVVPNMAASIQKPEFSKFVGGLK